MTTLYEQITSSDHFKELILNLSDEEKQILEKQIKEFVDSFEKNIIEPLKNI